MDFRFPQKLFCLNCLEESGGQVIEVIQVSDAVVDILMPQTCYRTYYLMRHRVEAMLPEGIKQVNVKIL